ncbi:toprim domain-containing protein [Ornithobacterium rhinotracheale]|uniref:toprim domain-containing protein n=4 Tax=Ornithobacterium rhinotracheale TaxID=28251 RepID=UPI0039FBDA33
MRVVMESFSLFPSKDNKRTAFYYALDRKENTPSLSVDFIKNTAFDFGTGKAYDNISIVQAIKKCSVSAALEYLAHFDFSFSRLTEDSSAEKKENHLTLTKTEKITHPALLNYLNERKLIDFKNELSEIHYTVKRKNYFGIGFKNDSDGYEIRNKYAKICMGKKDITTIKNKTELLRIFEGFSDYFSFLKLNQNNIFPPSDFLILNSVSMFFKAKNVMKKYPKLELYLDNDTAGNNLTDEIISEFHQAKDCRILYKNQKDLNEFIQSKNGNE